MTRLHLDDETGSRFNALRRFDLAAAASGRIEMVSVSEAGWSGARG